MYSKTHVFVILYYNGNWQRLTEYSKLNLSSLDSRQRLLIVGLAAPRPLLVERVLVRVVGHAELGEQASNDVSRSRVGVDVEALHSIRREVEGRQSASTAIFFSCSIFADLKA